MYLFRADGNAGTGAGHLMRCLTIAQALGGLQTEQEEILFLCADEESAGLVSAQGFAVKVLDSDYRKLEEELPAWERILSEASEVHAEPDSEDFAAKRMPGALWDEAPSIAQEETGAGNHHLVIIVDSYYVTDAYLQGLKKYGTVVLLDDMAQHAWPADAVINYNAFAREEAYKMLYRDASMGYYIGSRYIPIRQQFLEKSYHVTDQVKDILITVGGGDRENIGGAVLREIYEEIREYHLVTGVFNPHVRQLESLAEAHPNIHIHINVQDMAGLMERCGLAITAGGTTVYELAALGLPMICFSWAENQEALAEYVGREGMGGYAGAWHRDGEAVLHRIRELAAEFCNSRKKREQCSRRGKEMIDGRGAERLARALAEMRL